MRRSLWLVPLGIALACSSNVSGTIQLVVGSGEADPFTQAPAPTTLTVSTIDDAGISVLTQTALTPGGALTIPLPSQNTTTTATLLATGLDDAGDTVLWGETLPVEFSSLEGLSLPLFVQRTGELTRVPNPLLTAPVAPLVAILSGRFVLSINSIPGGDAGSDAAAEETSTQLYDLLAWAPLGSPPTLPVAPLALATVGTQALLVNGTNTVWYDFGDSSTSAPTLTTGQTFDSITGGVTVVDPGTGDSYVIVGAGTGASASTAVLYVQAATQGVSFTAQLAVARKGAAVAWWPGGNGVVVVGGSSMSPAAEVVTSGGSMGIATYPLDATVGGGATMLDATHLLLAGGVTAASGDAGGGKDPGARVLDLRACTQSTTCIPVPWNAPIPPLVSAQAFTIDSSTALVVGNDAMNNTHAYRMTQTGATEIAFKVPRKGATALSLPMIPIPTTLPTYPPVIVVGGDTTMESIPLL